MIECVLSRAPTSSTNQSQCHLHFLLFFLFNHTPPTEIYTLSLHDALPICVGSILRHASQIACHQPRRSAKELISNQFSWKGDRKSTRLNSSHTVISYAVFCLKKKKNNDTSNAN